MTPTWPSGGYIAPPKGTDLTTLVTVTPALVLAARRGFVQSFVIGGVGTFQDDDVQRAEDFFDDLAHKGYWSAQAYRDYAEMDPWKEDE